MAKTSKPYQSNPRNNLTAKYVRSILDYNPETGILRWKPRTRVTRGWNKRCAGKIAGVRDPSGYIKMRIKNVGYWAHRIIWVYVTGKWPKNKIDHKRGFSNKWTNLRLATQRQNGFNRGLNKNNKSGFKWVDWHRQTKKWRVRVNGYHLGLFADPQKGHAVACAFAQRLHGDFARFK